MAMRYFEYRKGRIEIIPMIDVMLFLLVFFIIVTLQMIPDAGINLVLPQSSQATHLPHPKFTVNLLADGTIKVKGTAMTPDQLTQLLSTDGNPAKTQVTIAADKGVQFQHFITVMDAARKADVSDVGVAAQPLGSGNDPADAGNTANAGGASAGATAGQAGAAPTGTAANAAAGGASGSMAAASAASGSVAPGSAAPATGTSASGTPASGAPASATPASGASASGASLPASSASAPAGSSGVAAPGSKP